MAKKQKTIRERIIEVLEEFNSIIAGLNLNWAEKIKGKIDYEKYVCPREEKRIEQFADQILGLGKQEFKRVVEKELTKHFIGMKRQAIRNGEYGLSVLECEKIKEIVLKAIEEL